MQIQEGRVQKPPSPSRYGAQSDDVLYGHAERITPKGRGVPSQAYVKWDNKSEGWELTADLQQRFRPSPPRTHTGAEW